MPYILKEDREKFMDLCDTLGQRAETKGELNYIVSRIIHTYVIKKGIGYTTASEAMDALRDAADEFYRTVLAPYENRKRMENGPVSELDQDPQQMVDARIKDNLIVLCTADGEEVKVPVDIFFGNEDAET